MLTTIEAVKEQLCIPTDDTSQDNMLERMIKAATDAIEAECRRDFEKQEYEESYYVDSFKIILQGYPVDTIAEIKLDDKEVTDYALNKNKGFVVAPNRENFQGHFEVKYTAGYILPGENNRDLPHDIENACITLAVEQYNIQGAAGIKMENVDQLRIQYSEQDMPKAVKRVIERHKDWRR